MRRMVADRVTAELPVILSKPYRCIGSRSRRQHLGTDSMTLALIAQNKRSFRRRLLTRKTLEQSGGRITSRSHEI